MRQLVPPITRIPAEAFYHPDGRLVIDYYTTAAEIAPARRLDQMDFNPTRRFTYIQKAGGEDGWDVLQTRPNRTPQYGPYQPWDACWEADPFRDIGMTLRFPHPTPQKKAKWRLMTNYDESQRQGIRHLRLNDIHYAYYSVRAYRTGLWLDFLENTTAEPHARLVAKVPLKNGWWRSPWHPPSSHPGFAAEWTEYPRGGHGHSELVACPNLGRHYRANATCLFDNKGNEYRPSKFRGIVTAACLGDVLAVGLTQQRIVNPGVIPSIPRIGDATQPMSATFLVLLDPDTLQVKAEYSFCTEQTLAAYDDNGFAVVTRNVPRPVDPAKFVLIAISHDGLTLAMVGRKRVTVIDIE